MRFRLGRSILLMALTLAFGCATKGDASKGRSRPPPLVVVASVERRDVPVEVRAPVELRPLTHAEIGSKVVGVLDTVLVERGDTVKKGQLLAVVRAGDLPDQYAAARGQLAQAEAQLAVARATFERVSTLLPEGLASGADMIAARGALSLAEAQRAAARAQVSASAQRLTEVRIEAPMDGQVALRRLEPGAVVGPVTSSLLTLVRTDVLRVYLSVPEKDVGQVRVGQTVHVVLDSLGATERFTGTILRLAPSLDPATRTLDAEVHLPNPSGSLRPGMYGRGTIVVATHPMALVVPSSALSVVESRRYVFVLANEGESTRVKRTYVETGIDGGTWIEVVKGLSASDEVVVAGLDVLADKSVVRVSRGVDPFSGAPAGSSSAGQR